MIQLPNDTRSQVRAHLAARALGLEARHEVARIAVRVVAVRLLPFGDGLCLFRRGLHLCLRVTRVEGGDSLGAGGRRFGFGKGVRDGRLLHS